MNLIRSNRTAAMKPIDNTTSNYEDNGEDLGSPTYRYKDGYFGGIIQCSSTSRIFGDGSDGAYTSSGNFTLGGLKQYTDLTISHTLTVDSTIKWLIIKVNGTFTFSGSITGNSAGGTGGSNTTSGTGGVGGAGSQYYATGGSGGVTGTQAGGASGTIYSALLNKTIVATGSTTVEAAGTSFSSDTAILKHILYNTNGVFFGYSSGGGGGGANTGANASGAGGAGGAGILIIAKNIVISGTPTITSTGANGSAGTGGSNMTGGGGGGGGGLVGILYHSLTGSLPTPTVTGGSGGAGGAGGTSGGAGAAGYQFSINI